MDYKALITAAALAFSPAVASADVITILDDGTTPIAASNDDLFLFDADTADGDYNHTFELSQAGAGTATVSITPNKLNLFATLVASWINADDNSVIASADLTGGQTTLSTTFLDPTSLNQILNLTYTLNKGTPDFIFDGDVTISTVPVPAGLLLMGTALAGLGMTRRKA